MTVGYDFPKIAHIRDVAPHADPAYFRHVEKDGFTFVNYMVACKETFPAVTDKASAVRRELRGIAFDAVTGDIVSRPYHKFFNLGERDDTSIEALDLSKDHFWLDKLDGSMVRPLPTKSGPRWATKMGFSDVAMEAEAFVAQNPRYDDFAIECFAQGLTPLFEFWHPNCRIVVDYGFPFMVLTGMRATVTGKYLSLAQMDSFCQRFNIPRVVENIHAGSEYFQGHVNHLMKRDGEEGCVVRFEDGHAVKVKNTWYTNLHRVKECLDCEHKLAGLILDNGLDDILSIMDETDKKRINAFASYFVGVLQAYAAEFQDICCDIYRMDWSRKDFALSETYSKAEKQVVFRIADKLGWMPAWVSLEEIMPIVIDKAKNACHKADKFEAFKEEIQMMEGVKDF